MNRDLRQSSQNPSLVNKTEEGTLPERLHGKYVLSKNREKVCHGVVVRRTSDRCAFQADTQRRHEYRVKGAGREETGMWDRKSRVLRRASRSGKRSKGRIRVKKCLGGVDSGWLRPSESGHDRTRGGGGRAGWEGSRATF